MNRDQAIQKLQVLVDAEYAIAAIKTALDTLQVPLHIGEPPPEREFTFYVLHKEGVDLFWIRPRTDSGADIVRRCMGPLIGARVEEHTVAQPDYRERRVGAVNQWLDKVTVSHPDVDFELRRRSGEDEGFDELIELLRGWARTRM